MYEDGIFSRYQLRDLLVAEHLNTHPEHLTFEDAELGTTVRSGHKLYNLYNSSETSRAFDRQVYQQVADELAHLSISPDLQKYISIEHAVREIALSGGYGLLLAPYDGMEVYLALTEPKRMLTFCRTQKLFEGQEYFDKNPFVEHPDRYLSWYMYRQT